MKRFCLVACLLSISYTAFAYQEGTYNCTVDAFTTSTVVVKSVNLTPEIQVPYVEYTYYSRGVSHRIKGIAHTDAKTTEKRDQTTKERFMSTEEVLHIPTLSHEIISFSKEGDVSKNCEKVK